jgi:ABC-type ATPase with predicted acetyltransferase domain
MATYILNKSFKTSVDRTARVLEIAEAFGLGLSDKEFTLYRDLAVEVDAGDVVYITGQSGSGKSQALVLLAEQMAASGLVVADLNTIELDPDKPVIDQVGATTMEATDLLAKAGISDAYIYLRKPHELSDGQRYRLKLAKVMGSDAQVWIADEFGAVLDRVTAKVVAFSMQKVARRLGKTLMVATTHDDLVAELAPSLTIRKRFKDRVELERAA